MASESIQASLQQIAPRHHERPISGRTACGIAPIAIAGAKEMRQVSSCRAKSIYQNRFETRATRKQDMNMPISNERALPLEGSHKRKRWLNA